MRIERTSRRGAFMLLAVGAPALLGFGGVAALWAWSDSSGGMGRWIPAALVVAIAVVVAAGVALYRKANPRPDVWSFDSEGWTRQDWACPTPVTVPWSAISRVESQYMRSGNLLLLHYETLAGPKCARVGTSLVRREAIRTLVDQISSRVPPERVQPNVLTWGSNPDPAVSEANTKSIVGVATLVLVILAVLVAAYWYTSTQM